MQSIVKMEQKCTVCGGKASGFHFNRITCSACKSFFRRTAHEFHELKCYRGGSCLVDQQNRKYCRSCRLAKCFRVGMNPNLINIFAEKQRSPNNSSSSSVNINQNLFITNIYVLNYPKGASLELKLHELGRLYEVQHAMVSSFADENRLISLGRAASVEQVMNGAGFNARSVVKFCKGVQAFEAMVQQNQVALLKGFYPEKSAVRVAYLFDRSRDGWNGLGSEAEDSAIFVQLNMFRSCPRLTGEMIDTFRQFVSDLHDQIEGDETIRDLILCTLLFKSRPMPLSCPEYTRFHFVYYNYLLRRYLEAKHRSVGVAAEKYFRLMEQLQSIDKVTAIIRTVYEALGPQRLTQVLVEIYGLEEKQHQPSAN